MRRCPARCRRDSSRTGPAAAIRYGTGCAPRPFPTSRVRSAETPGNGRRWHKCLAPARPDHWPDAGAIREFPPLPPHSASDRKPWIARGRRRRYPPRPHRSVPRHRGKCRGRRPSPAGPSPPKAATNAAAVRGPRSTPAARTDCNRQSVFMATNGRRGANRLQQGFHAHGNPGGIGGRIVGFDAKIGEPQLLLGQTPNPVRLHVVGQASLPDKLDDALRPIVGRQPAQHVQPPIVGGHYRTGQMEILFGQGQERIGRRRRRCLPGAASGPCSSPWRRPGRRCSSTMSSTRSAPCTIGHAGHQDARDPPVAVGRCRGRRAAASAAERCSRTVRVPPACPKCCFCSRALGGPTTADGRTASGRPIAAGGPARDSSQRSRPAAVRR